MPRRRIFRKLVENLMLIGREYESGSPSSTPTNPSTKRLPGGGRKLKDADIDREIFTWFTEKRSQGVRVTGKALLVEAQRRFLAGGITSFKASRGWLQKWKARHSVSTREKTTVAQKMPAQIEEKIISFHRFVILMRKLRNYPISDIGNMDETSVYFDMPAIQHYTTKAKRPSLFGLRAMKRTK